MIASARVGDDRPESSRASENALHFAGDLLGAKSAKDGEATMRFFSRDTLTYADGTLGIVFEGWEALHGAYSSMMLHGGAGESYPVMVTAYDRRAFAGPRYAA